MDDFLTRITNVVKTNQTNSPFSTGNKVILKINVYLIKCYL